jgi:serine/threonine protein kinase
MTHVLALPTGTELVGDFRIERVLGAGGFGITYLATETALARQVTIKEYFPSDFAARNEDLGAVPRSSDSAGDYQWGLDRFLDEAQTLALFDHRNICRVYRYFRANNTGYMVLHFEEGASLKGWIKGLGRAPRQAELDLIIAPLLEALEIVHAADFLHRDIAPDNIMVRTDGSPVLIDFGSARGDIAQHSRKVSALVKPGYSPYEQYAETGKQQGPWTDIYALGATLYHCVTGKRPPDSPSRIVKDEYVPAKDAALSSYRPKFLAAIDRSLMLDIDKRPPTVHAWRAELLANAGEKPVKSGWLKKAKDAKH